MKERNYVKVFYCIIKEAITVEDETIIKERLQHLESAINSYLEGLDKKYREMNETVKKLPVQGKIEQNRTKAKYDFNTVIWQEKMNNVLITMVEVTEYEREDSEVYRDIPTCYSS
jgi:hypothetical protein